MTTNKWKGIIDSCQGVSNVTLVCSDGTLHSHKIMIAVVSGFMKDLMMSIPAADNVTILLPDFLTANVLSIIDQFNFGDMNMHLLNEDLMAALKCTSSNEMLDEVFREENDIERLEDSESKVTSNDFDNSDSKPVSISITPSFSGDIDMYNPLLNIKSDPDSDREEKYIVDEKDEAIDDKQWHSNKPFGSGYGPRTKFRDLAKQFLINDEGKDKSLVGGLKKINIEMKMKYRAAVEGLAGGQCYSLAEAESKYGICRKTLKKMLESGRDFQGKGCPSLVFSEAEELILKESILKRIEAGETLTRSMVQKVLDQEFDTVRSCNPDRPLPSALPNGFIRGFLSRNDLGGYIQAKPQGSPGGIDRLENQQRIVELAKKFLLNDDDLFTCDDDNSLRGEKKKLINEKRQKHRSAIEAIAKGEVATISEASKQFGVERKTLSRILETGKNYQGKGKVSHVFTYEEEKSMTERILAKSDGGKTLTIDIVTDVLNEELNIKRINHPEKNLPESYVKSFKYNFVKRNNLDKFIQAITEAAIKDRRIFECEICYNKFTFKNSLVSHLKKCHSAFYTY